MTQKKNLNEYITTVSKTKPSAEVKFRTTTSEGEVTETIASRKYVAEHADKEFDAVKQIAGLNDRLRDVTERAQKQIDEDEQQLEENAAVEFRDADAPQDDSPFTHVPVDTPPNPEITKDMSETAMLIKLVETLIDKIDEMQNFNPVIHVPAPVIHVTLPETRKTVTKAIERDSNNFIKTVRESIEEAPAGEPLIEVKQEDAAPKKRTKKDSK